MKEYIIGKEGTQKFPINNSRVSRRHARITITDDNKWILEDLGSTNGTYILNENNELVQIKKMEISEFTRIVLADQTAMGYTFYAHHVIEEDPKNYVAEFRYVMKVYNEALSLKTNIDAKASKRNTMLYLPPVISAAIGVILTCLLPMQLKIICLSVMGLITAVITAAMKYHFGKDGSKKDFNSKYVPKLVCPHCGRQLTDKEFQNQMCAACKAHA